MLSSDGLRSDKMGSLLVKPCKQAEIDFYEETCDQHPEFQFYMPLHYGVLEPTPAVNLAAEPSLSFPAHLASARIPDPPVVIPRATVIPGHSRASSRNLQVAEKIIAPSAPETWVPSGGAAIAAENNIVLENVADGYEKPNVLDVKLGRRLWADDAPPAKRHKLDKVSAETTSSSLGYRIAGMKTWIGERSFGEDIDPNGYRKRDKSYGRSFTAGSIRTGFEDYFFVESAGVTRNIAKKVIERFVDDLRGLHQALEGEESRIYSSSLLFVYEGDGEALRRKLEQSEQSRSSGVDVTPDAPAHLVGNESESLQLVPDKSGHDDDEFSSSASEDELFKVQSLKVIDFAHASWTPGQGRDINMLDGIENVIKALEDLLL